MEEQIKILCNKDDPNIDNIASRMAVIKKAILTNNLVAISCKDEDYGDKILLAVTSANDETKEFINYSPIGTLFYEHDVSYKELTPPSSAIPTEDDDVKH